MIFIDHAVGSRELVPLIPDSLLVDLDYADVCFTGNGPEGVINIGIERKTLGDLVSSIESGRLAGHQLPGLLDRYNRVYLLVEGVMRDNPSTGVFEVLRGKFWTHVKGGSRRHDYMGIQHYLSTLEEMAGVRVEVTDSLASTAMFIRALFAWWQKPYDKHHAHKAYHRPSSPTLRHLTWPEQFAVGLPLIGYERAKACAEHFGNVPNMLAASEEEWSRVKGLGKLTARHVWRALHEEEGE